jgi:hypothetical protein
MAAPQSNSDLFLIAFPMVALLLAAFFRLDELFCRPSRRPEVGRRLSSWDEDGTPTFTDPAPTVYAVSRRKH